MKKRSFRRAAFLLSNELTFNGMFSKTSCFFKVRLFDGCVFQIRSVNNVRLRET